MSPVLPTTASAEGRTSAASRLRSVLGAGAILTVLLACGGNHERATVTAAPPTFTTQPTDVTVVAGDKGTFSATATGTPTYQWVKNNASVSGATAPTYTTAATTAADNNAVFSVTATTSGGTVSSTFATLHVNYAALSMQPVDAAVNPGQTATFSVTAYGSGTLSYQWAKGGTAIPAATGATLSLPAVALADSAAYTCTVTSALNGTTAQVTSSAGNLVVKTGPPVITAQPADVTLAAGDTATFSVTATNALTYQWYWNGLPIQGATSASYSFPAIGGNDGTALAVVVSNPQGTVTSAVAHVHVNFVRMVTEAADRILPEGAALSLSPVVQATGALSYQWSKDGVAIPGATAATYALAPVLPAAAGTYTCAYTSQLGATTMTLASQGTKVEVVGNPVITLHPQSGTYQVGEPLGLEMAATQVGAGNLTYQWKHDGVAVPLAFEPRLFLQSLKATDAGAWTCEVTNTLQGIKASVSTLPAQLLVTGWPIIGNQPASITVYEGRPASFTITASGPGTLTYQWYRNGVAIPGATASTYTLAATTLADNQAAFYCIVSNGILPNATTSSAILTVNPVPTATDFQVTTQLITKGQGVTFTYLFNPLATATFGPQGGTAVPVSSGGSSVIFPDTTTTYTLTVTVAGVSTPNNLTVTVKTYTPKALYVVNRDSNNIYQYPVNPNAPRIGIFKGFSYDPGLNSPADALVGTPKSFKAATGLNPNHMSATFDEKYLFVANRGDATISVYTADPITGILSPVAGGPFALPTGYTNPWCALPDPAAQRLYVTCAEGIAVLTIDGATGALTAQPSASYSLPGYNRGDLLIHPSGKYLYAADSGHSLIRAFSINATTGALTPNGADMTPTYRSGYAPYWDRDITNPSSLVFDRASSMVFTRTTDPLTWFHGEGAVDYKGAVDSYAVDPYTGTLTHQATSRSSSDTPSGRYLVGPDSEDFHTLAFSAMPGANHLFSVFSETSWGAYLSDYVVNMDPTAPDYGSFSSFYDNPNWGPYPWWARTSSNFEGGAVGILQDRSGKVFAALYGVDNYDKFLAFGCDANGSISYMGTGVVEVTRDTGTMPIHGLFLGTQN